MTLPGLLRTTWSGLRRTPTRTIAGASAMAMSVAVFLLLSAAGMRADRDLKREAGGFGGNIVVVSAGRISTFAGRREVVGRVSSLRESDLASILHSVPSVAEGAPSQYRNLPVKRDGLVASIKTVGTTNEFFAMRDFRLASGRWFAPEDRMQRVAIVGSAVRTLLFRGAPPVGERLVIAGIPFQIIGSLRPRGASAGGADEDNQIFLPIGTALRRVFNGTSLNALYFRARAGTAPARAAGEIRAALRNRHRLDQRDKPDDFTVQWQASADAAGLVVGKYSGLLGLAILAVVAVLGGAGVGGAMVLSVRQRRQEIGVRLAVGARPRDILEQFLLESLAMGTVGLLVGLLLGTAGMAAFSGELRGLSPTAVIPPVSAAALAAAILGGLFPAYRASRLVPLEAITAQQTGTRPSAPPH